MNFLKNFINKFYSYFNKIIFNYKSQKISKLFRKLSKLNKIHIYDFGAGLRYLPTLLKFDGISKIHLIDPNDNLEISYRNLKNLFSDKSSIKKYKVAISEKNEKIFYYPAKQSTGSSFIDLKKTGKEKEFSQSYFGNEKKILKQVYDFETFKKKNHLKKPDIIKIDVEGFEFKILKSILKKNKPLIIEIEVNFDSSLTGDTFLQVHNILKKK
jgi:FkbM family methyltransferase